MTVSTKPLTALALAGFLASSLAGPADAQTGTRRQFRDLGPSDPSYSGVPYVPDEQGCEKWCFRDTSPCDPPEFKRADGRCDEFN